MNRVGSAFEILFNIDWNVIATVVSSLAAVWAVIVASKALNRQKIEFKNQNEFQRDTFVLQNSIDEEKTLIEIASTIIVTINSLIKVKNDLYKQTAEILDRKKANINGMNWRAQGNELFADMTEFYYQEAKYEYDKLIDMDSLLEAEFNKQISKLKIHVITLGEKEITSVRDISNDLENKISKINQKISDIKDGKIDISKEPELNSEYIQDIKRIVGNFGRLFEDLRKETKEKVSNHAKTLQ